MNVNIVFVYFDDHHLGAFNNGAVPEIGGAEIEITISVHGCSFEDHDINGFNEAAIIIGNFAKVHRDVLRATGIMLLAVIARKMEA